MIRIAAETPWYDVFSRGARDWLRHNQKVREAVKESLPDLLAGADLMSKPGSRTVLVPVKFLEHARFRLLDPQSQKGAGQGKGEPGDVLQPGREEGDQGSQAGGTKDGEIRFVVELKIDEIVDWLWEELKLPELKPRRSATIDEPDFVREGWDKRGARARLDRRRTVKEAVKRRSIQEDAIPFTNDDLRFRQLVKRSTPSINAAVIFALDVSDGENAAEDRDGAKSSLRELANLVNYAGYVETGGIATFRPRETQLAELFAEFKTQGLPVGTSHLAAQEDVWRAIREFFQQESRHD